MLTYIIFFTVIGLIIAFAIGINLSSNIDDTVLYFLFWMMYIITIGTLVNIGLSGYYYSVMQAKTGPRGPRGDRGEAGDPGELGECDPECRTGLCQSGILEEIVRRVAKEEAKSGVPVEERLTVSGFQNVFIKERIKSMCSSPEYSQLAPYKGEQNLINYLKTIWGDIAVGLYKSGGSAYFKTIGAENSWDWVTENPWNEFKKYDVYYWGLGKEYRPIMEEKCDAPGAQTAQQAQADISHVPNTLNILGLTKSGGVYSPPSKRDSKYSILGYVNIPNSVSTGDASGEGTDGMSTWVSVRGKTNTLSDLKLYSAPAFTPTAEVLEQERQKAVSSGKKNARLPTLKPMSYLVANPNNPDLCAKSTGRNGDIRFQVCNPYDPAQVFQMQFTGDKDSKMQEFRIQNTKTKAYLGANRNQLIQKSTNKSAADIFTFN
jgi:hypothetical protein